MRYKVSFELETHMHPRKWFQQMKDLVLSGNEMIYEAKLKQIKEPTNGGSTEER